MGLGTFRYFLAFFVLASHLWLDMPHGFAAYSVWGFFLLSGFLMSYVVDNKYRYSYAGIMNYFYNRALRIYPLYWISFLIGITSMLILEKHGVNYKLLNPGFGYPDSLYHWICNILLLPDYFFSNPVPVANALRIECFYYLLIPFFARYRLLAWLGFLAGAIWNIYILMDPTTNHVDSFGVRYATIGPCSIAFIGGSLLYHYKDYLAVFSNKYLSIVAWILHACIWLYFPYYPWGMGLYISLFFTSWVILSLYKETSSKWDIFLGDLSYPVYLLHTTIGALLMNFFSDFRSLKHMLTGLFVTNIVCYLLIKAIDKPLKKWKKI
jgi:peptidoglycan/LPS O-acetylase OafA/YrhL